MLNLKTIHKPTSLEEAVKLLQQPGTVAWAGGTELIADSSRPPQTKHLQGPIEAAVDLSTLGLAYIRESSGMIVIGAMTTLAALAESPILRAFGNGVLAQAAQHSVASVLRNQGTAAGTLISKPDGILAVTLLALDAQVTIVRQEARKVPLAEFLSMREHLLNMALLTEIAVPLTNPRATVQSVARTPRDQPIVAVCAAARFESGIARNVRIALGGVGQTAVRAKAAEQALEGQAWNDAVIESAATKAAEGLSPQGDFRGSVEYRQEMAVVLTRRAVKELAA